jgi:TonB family protein
MLVALFKITAVLVAGLLLLRLCRGRSAAFRHRVLGCTIAVSLAVPVLSTLLPGWHAAAFDRVIVQPVKQRISPAPPDTAFITSMRINAESRIPYYQLALGLWILGSIVFLARLGAGIPLRFRGAKPLFDESYMRLVIRLAPDFAVVRPVRLLLAQNDQAMPVTWGFLQPRILLPADALTWPDERRRIVLSHELAHIGRNDWLWQMVAEVAAAIYWFHPISWMAASHLRQESERAADDAVLNSGVKPSNYASELLELSRTLTDSGRLCHTALAMARTSHLERRFMNMLNTSTNRRRLSRTASVATALAAVAVMLPLAALRLPAQERAGKFTGSIYDPRSAAIPNATIIMTNAKAHTKDMTTADATGQFVFGALPAGQYEMRVLQPGFQPYVVTGVNLQPAVDAKQDATLILGAVNERVDVVATGFGNSGSTDNSAPKRIRVGGNVQAANLIAKVAPLYPPAAKAARIQGSVLLQAEIAEDGSLSTLAVLSTQIDPDLARAAVEAVQQWKYKPTLLNGEPIAVITNITVNFTLQQ